MKIQIKFVLMACLIAFATATGVGRVAAATDVPLEASTGVLTPSVTNGAEPLQHDHYHPPSCDMGDHCCAGGHDCPLNNGRQACVGSPCSCFVQSEGHTERGFVCHGEHH
jgi:hypothetical protein